MNLLQLQDKFAPDDIEWRIGRSGYTRAGKLYGMVLAYITNRAIMTRLDEVCGPGNWRNEFREWNVGTKHGVLCGISIRIGDEWVTKWDGAENTDIESVKGGLSDAMKRAGVQWGIGRYLYDLPAGFAVIEDDGKHFTRGKDSTSGRDYQFRWNAPALPEWAVPSRSEKKTAVRPVVTTEKIPVTRRPIEVAPASKRP